MNKTKPKIKPTITPYLVTLSQWLKDKDSVPIEHLYGSLMWVSQDAKDIHCGDFMHKDTPEEDRPFRDLDSKAFTEAYGAVNAAIKAMTESRAKHWTMKVEKFIRDYGVTA